MKNVLLSLVAVAGLAAAANAQVYTETTDAGELPGTAITPSGSGPLLSIVTTLEANGADMYRINISNPALFSATTGPSTVTDTKLFLFRLDGTGVAFNDDTVSGSNNSTLPVGNPFLTALTAGDYYIAVSGYNYDPRNGTTNLFVNTFSGVFGPSSALAVDNWTNNGFSSAAGTVTITLTGASYGSVPAPASFALVGLGGLVAARRRRA